MNDETYLRHCRQLLESFSRELERRCEHLPEADPLRELAAGFTGLADGSGDLYGVGTALVSRLFTTYPELAPLFPRDLLWFLGGDCLHYMPDEELDLHQKLDEMRATAASRGETLDLGEARAKLLKLQ